MTLGQLKKSLNRFSGDFDNSEVLMTFIITKENIGNDSQLYDNLAFVGYVEAEDMFCIILGTNQAALDKIKNGTLRYLDNSEPPSN